MSDILEKEQFLLCNKTSSILISHKRKLISVLVCCLFRTRDGFFYDVTWTLKFSLVLSKWDVSLNWFPPPSLILSPIWLRFTVANCISEVIVLLYIKEHRIFRAVISHSWKTLTICYLTPSYCTCSDLSIRARSWVTYSIDNVNQYQWCQFLNYCAWK